MTVNILVGDCRDRLKELPDESVQCVVTSPPYYGLRTYGTDLVDWPACSFAPMPGMPAIELEPWTGELGLEPTPEMYIAHVVLVFREVRRVLREDGAGAYQAWYEAEAGL